MSQQPRILIVDDNPNNRLALRTLLKGVDAQLHEAGNGLDALSMLTEDEYAMILLDVQMPEMDGYEVCEQLRADPKTADTPVVFLTAAYKEDIDKIRGYVAGATDYLAKPIDDHVLLAKVQVFLKMFSQSRLLQESESRMRAILDTALDAVVGMNSEGKIIEWNLRAESIFGWSKEEALGQPLEEVIVPTEHREGHRRGLARFLASGEQELLDRRIEVTAIRRNGVEFPIELAITPLKTGMDFHFTAFIRDISKRKAAEAELERHRHHLEALVQERTTELSIAKDAAESASRAKSIFLANMSHELRTPMNGIMGMTNIALRAATDPKQRDQLSKVIDSSQRLLGIINDVLDMTKIEAERLSLEDTGFELAKVVESVTNVVEADAINKGLQFDLQLSPELGNMALRGDPLRLGQILINLTSNAIKFTSEGAVTVQAALTEERPTDVLVRFEIRDTGIGMSPEEQHRLFIPFEQGDGSMTRKYGGTGLGLAITKRLVEMMGGSIGVDSQLGQGSKVWFTARLKRDAKLDMAHAANSDADAEALIRQHDSN